MSKAVTRSNAESASGSDDTLKLCPMSEIEPEKETGVPDDSSSSSAGEMNLLLEERKRVARKISRQKRSMEREAIRQEIAGMKDELESKDSYRINAVHSIPHQLTDDEGLRPTTGRGHATGGVDVVDSISTRSGSTTHRSSRRRGKQNLQSGVLAKPTDRVLFPQDWPHIALQSDKAPGVACTFQDLDHDLFVAGELELISRMSISETEQVGRLRLLKQLMYMGRVYDWQTILRLYSEVVSQIEKGLLTWASQFDPTLIWAINSYGFTKSVVKNPTKVVNPKKSMYKARPTYCKDFQNGSCQSTELKHWGFVNGEKVQVEHICAVCLLKRKEVCQHSESSTECPFKGHSGSSR